jgi:hypothetical protein
MQHMNSSGLSTQPSSAENNRLQGTSNRAVARSAAPEAKRYANQENTALFARSNDNISLFLNGSLIEAIFQY